MTIKIKSTSNTIQAFWVAIGSLISYGFILLTSMILSRYFSKGDYGTYKQVMYVYSTLLVVFTLGLPRAYAYFLPRVSLSEAKDTINKITYLFFALGILFSLILYFGSSIIAFLLKNPELDYALNIFSLVPMFMLPTMGLEGILATYKKTRYIAVYKGLSSLFQLLFVSIPVIFFNGTYIAAIVGFAVSSLIICIIALYLKTMPVRKEKKLKSRVKYRDLFSFSIPLLYASFWSILMNSADQFFISNYFGNEVFAEFSNGWMDLPFVSLVVGATSVVLLPVFSKIINESESAYEQIKLIWISVFEKTAKLIYPLLMYCIVFSEVIMIVLYGDMYSNSGYYFRIKLMVNFFNLIAFAPLMLAMGATKQYAKVIAYWAIITVILEFSFVKIFDSPFTIAVISSFCHIGLVVFMLKYIAKFLKTTVIEILPLKLMACIVIITLPILLVLYYIFVIALSISNISIVFSTLIIYLIVFYFISSKMNIDYASIVQPLFKKLKIKDNNEK